MSGVGGICQRYLKSQVSRICADIDLRLQVFLNRPLQDLCYAYLYHHATYLYGRHGKAMQVCSSAVVVSMGVNVDGRRQLLGHKFRDIEFEAFCSQFIGSLKELGFSEVKLVISHTHKGITNSIRQMLKGSSCWQCCRVNFARNLHQSVPKAHQGMVTPALCSVFAQEKASEIEARWDDKANSLG
jgi:putative transposase